MSESGEKRILESWERNAGPWIKAIEQSEIQSRVAVTDGAILAAAASVAARRVLDIGCGEGWLARALSARGVSVTGIDATNALVKRAAALGGGEFKTLEYQQLSADLPGGRYEAAIANFSLLGKESVEQVFNALPTILNEGGYFIVQTLHPFAISHDQPYADGWREGSWSGFSADFSDPAPWYFRTVSAWCSLFVDKGFSISQIREPLNPGTGTAASLLMVGRLGVSDNSRS